MNISFIKAKKEFYIWGFVSLISYLLSLSVASAQTVPLQSIRVTPIINDLQLTAGKNTSFPLTIENLSSDPIGIHSEITGYDQIGEVPIFAQKPSKIINWTHLSNTDILIPPHSKKAITVTINMPANLGPSGYYETIFLTPIINQQLVPGKPIILSRIGVLILGTTGTLNYNDLVKKVTVTDVSPANKIVNTFPETILFTVNNYYFTHFDAKPFLTLTPLLGNSQTVLLADKHVLPGSKRIWEYQPIDDSPNFIYRIHLAVSVGGGKQVMYDSWFIVLPYKMLIVILFVFVLLYIGIAKRKRFGEFITILFRG